MGWVHVKIMLKLSFFLIIGLLIAAGFGVLLGYILLPNLEQRTEFIVNYFTIQKGMPPVTLIFLFAIGIFTILILTYILAFKIAYWFIETSLSWEDAKKEYPKLFGVN